MARAAVGMLRLVVGLQLDYSAVAQATFQRLAVRQSTFFEYLTKREWDGFLRRPGVFKPH